MQQLNKDFKKKFVIVTHDPRVAKATERIIYLVDGQLSTLPTIEMEWAF